MAFSRSITTRSSGVVSSTPSDTDATPTTSDRRSAISREALSSASRSSPYTRTVIPLPVSMLISIELPVTSTVQGRSVQSDSMRGSSSPLLRPPSSLSTMYIVALFTLPPDEAPPMPKMAPSPPDCMTPTVSTSGSSAKRAAISSHTAAVSASVASSSSETETLIWLLSIAGINANPREMARTAETASNATEPSKTGALCRSVKLSARV